MVEQPPSRASKADLVASTGRVPVANLLGVLSSEFGRLTRRLRKPTGQITGDDGLAAWLRAIAADPNVYLFMEIGAWEGNGSTRILREAADVKLWVGRTSGARLREHDRGNVIE